MGNRPKFLNEHAANFASAREAVFGFYSETTMKLSVIIPAYNEFSTIAETLIDIHFHLCKENIIFEIIVVNDNSNDGTPDLVDKLSLHYKNIRRVDNITTNCINKRISHILL